MADVPKWDVANEDLKFVWSSNTVITYSHVVGMNKCSMMRRKDWSQFWRCVQVQNGWNIQSYLPNALIRGKIIGPLEIHVVQNCHFKFHLSFLTKTYVTYYIWKHSLVRCLYHASTASCSARSKKKSQQEHKECDCPVTVTQYC